jgi:hypothetical protein
LAWLDEYRIFSTKPKLNKSDMRDDPPYETNGNGCPVKGMIPVIAAKLINV